MARKTIPAFGVLLLLCVLVFSGCDQFFSTSWGTARDYDPGKIKLNAGNVDSWVTTAVGNPKLATALTDKIKDELKGVPPGNPSKDQEKLQEAGVTLAIEASGIGESILSNASGLISKLSDDENLEEAKDTVTELLGDIQNDFRSNNGSKAAGNLAEIISGSLDPNKLGNGDNPEFSGLYAEKAKPSDVGQAVMVLALSIIEDKGLNVSSVDLDHLESQSLGITIENGRAKIDENADQKTIVLAAYLNLIAEDKGGKFGSNSITSAIKEAFGISQ
jgi:hypothetical protein